MNNEHPENPDLSTTVDESVAQPVDAAGADMNDQPTDTVAVQAASIPPSEPEPELTQAQIQALQDEERQKAVDAARLVDPTTFLSMSQLSYLGNHFYRNGHRFYLNEDAPAVKLQGINKIALIHIAGQALIKAIAPFTIFTEEDFQKAFNNVSLIDTTGASDDKQELMTQTAMAMTAMAWSSAERYRNDLGPILDAFTIKYMEGLRIPPTKDGGEFTGIDLLFEPSAGRFMQFSGIVLKYADVDPSLPTGNNIYAIVVSDLRGENEEKLGAVVFLQDIVNLRNAETERYIHADVPNQLGALVALLGDGLLKQTDLNAAANDDGERLEDEAALMGEIEGTGQAADVEANLTASEVVADQGSTEA